MRKLRLILAVLVMATLPVITTIATPAAADHDGRAVCVNEKLRCAHWGNGYSPPVYSNYAAWGFDFIQDAGYFWQDYGFRQGWNPAFFPAQGYSECGTTLWAIDGGIIVCWVSPGNALLQGNEGTTYVWNFDRCDTACNHIYSATIYVNWDLAPAARQMILRHEMGHALGLGHSAASDSIMHLPVNQTYANWDDFYSMNYLMYNDHE